MTSNGPDDESSDDAPGDESSEDEPGTGATATDERAEESTPDRPAAEDPSPGEPSAGESTDDGWVSKAPEGSPGDGSPWDHSSGTPPEEQPGESLEESPEEPSEEPSEESPGEPPEERPRRPPEEPSGEPSPDEPATGGSAAEATTGEGSTGRSLAYLGYSAVIVGFGGVLASMILTPWFSVFTGALSFLGFRRVAVAPLFNGSLIVGGVLGAGLVATLWATAEQPFHLAAVPFLLLATVCMSLVGRFPIPAGPHLAVAAAFFGFLTVGVFLWGAGDYAAGRGVRAATFLLLPVVHVVAWLWWFVLPWAPPGIALPELAGVVALVVWTLWVSADLHGLTGEPLPAF